MFTDKVEPRLERLAGATRLFYREMRTAGLTESEVEQRTAPIYTQYESVQTTILTAPGEIQLHLRLWSSDYAAAEHTLEEMIERITLALGENVFTSNGQKLEEIVAHEMTLNQRDRGYRGKLHWRIARRKTHPCSGKLLVFSGRGRLL